MKGKRDPGIQSEEMAEAVTYLLSDRIEGLGDALGKTDDQKAREAHRAHLFSDEKWRWCVVQNLNHIRRLLAALVAANPEAAEALNSIVYDAGKDPEVIERLRLKKQIEDQKADDAKREEFNQKKRAEGRRQSEAPFGAPTGGGGSTDIMNDPADVAGIGGVE